MKSESKQGEREKRVKKGKKKGGIHVIIGGANGRTHKGLQFNK